MDLELPLLSEAAADRADRAALHRALGDERRLAIVDALQLSDRSPSQLATLTGLSSNLVAFHLDVLEDAGLIRRTTSQGDARRRYVVLERDRLTALTGPGPVPLGCDAVVFVCTANSARSQLAAHLWHARTGCRPLSAGTHPADAVHPGAVAVARRHGLDLAGAKPGLLDDLDVAPDLVVSVCDRALESSLDLDAPQLHWSVPDPAEGDDAVFEATFADLADRIDRLARALPATRTAPHPGGPA
ncbi:helix-turn-helix domain-containing protein [Nitriliruptoraceae bacterium ZYF776]|nr:helix-turn-helix domain-containing protein [Profundirhabdus halotolerans]